MKLRIVTVSSRAPQWIQQGYDEYARRMPRAFGLDLVEVKPEVRPAGIPSLKTIQKIKESEAARIRTHLDGYDWVVALDEQGASCSTKDLVACLQRWQSDGRNAAFVIGGADGLDEALLRQSQQQLSLSAMTLPHQLVRVMLAEQLYRAASILDNHPYHRG